MIFAARGLAVSSSVFVLLYCALSIAVALAWRPLWIHARRYPAVRIADLLFALRMLPFSAAAVITGAFIVPSFVLLEPRAIQEPIGGVPLFLGICGAGFVAYGLFNAVRALSRASRAISGWTRNAQELASVSAVPVLRVADPVPAMVAAGIARPRVLLSGTAELLLSSEELQRAMDHELAHVRRRDNLRKLLLRFVAFPGMFELEAAWVEASEMAADDLAVSTSREALDLAAALIKLSRVNPQESPADLTAALIHSPLSSVNDRVARLIAWNDDRGVRQGFSAMYVRAGAVVTLATLAVTYMQLLVRIHTVTEWLIR